MVSFNIILATALSFSSVAFGWLPTRDGSIIRGVNLGGMFIVEPWMMTAEWQRMGCGAYKSEFDCVSGLGQAKANQVFHNHWQTWMTKDDFAQMNRYGINTIRIPLGYWIKEDLVYKDSEHFPQGALVYLTRMVRYAKKYNIYVILDLHGAPGAQASNPFTGQDTAKPGFYVDYQYERAYEFLTWMVNITHTNPSYSTVGAIQLVNEPLSWQQDTTATMISQYYPTAIQRIRTIEAELGVPANKRLHITTMSETWGSGNPVAHVADKSNILYDDHHYVKWDTSVATTTKAYMAHSCTNSRLTPGSTIPLVVGEWSLSVADSVQTSGDFGISPMSADTKKWYQDWFIAQAQNYELGQGWIFWSWKITLDDWRWGYQAAVLAGIIPTDLNTIKGLDVCVGYKSGTGKREEEAVLPEVDVNSTLLAEDPEAARRSVHISKHRRHNHHARNFAASI